MVADQRSSAWPLTQVRGKSVVWTTGLKRSLVWIMRTTTENPSLAWMPGRYKPKRTVKLPERSTEGNAPTSFMLITGTPQNG